MNEPNPEVGQGATILSGTDAYPATVIEVNRSGKSCIIQEDKAHLTQGQAFKENQDAVIEPNPNGPTYQVRIRKTGKWRVTKCESYSNPESFPQWREKFQGHRVVFGRRSFRRDPSF